MTTIALPHAKHEIKCLTKNFRFHQRKLTDQGPWYLPRQRDPHPRSVVPTSPERPSSKVRGTYLARKTLIQGPWYLPRQRDPHPRSVVPTTPERPSSQVRGTYLARETLILQPPDRLLVGRSIIPTVKPRPDKIRRAFDSAASAPIARSSSYTLDSGVYFYFLNNLTVFFFTYIKYPSINVLL